MHTEPSTTDKPNSRTNALRTRLSSMDDTAQDLWLRHVTRRSGPPAPVGKQWLVVIALAAFILTVALIWLTALVDFLGKALAGGAGWNHADPAGLVADPVRAYLTAHTAGIGVDAATLFWTWCAAGIVFLLIAVAGNVGARIGWALHGVATALMVFAGTPNPGRPVATGLTVTFWAVLSIAAYRRVPAQATVDAHLTDGTVSVERVARW